LSAAHSIMARMSRQDLRPGVVRLHPVASDFANLGITTMEPMEGLILDPTYVAVLTNQRGRIIWDCSTAVPHPGKAHPSNSDALSCAHDELARRR
jgi:hypothetical protein